MRPNLICPGASKSATTTLYDILRKHPDVYTGTIKEPHFFDTEELHKGLNYYEKNYYPDEVNAKIITDFTPSYMQNPQVAENIRGLLGDDIKIIIMLRNPIDRAFSAYCFEKQRGNINSSSFNDEINKLTDPRSANPKYIIEGLYCEQVKKYLEIFPKENIRIYLFEDFVANMQKVMDEITKFLGISRMELKKDVHSNKTRITTNAISAYYLKARYKFQLLVMPLRRGKYSKYLFSEQLLGIIKYAEKNFFDNKNHKPVLSKEHREILQKYYREDVMQLKKITNINYKKWKDFNRSD